MKSVIPFSWLVVGFAVLVSCATSNPAIGNKTMDHRLENGHLIISAQIVEKTLTKKNSKVSSHTDYYVRRSVQDYFIKFCDGFVSKKELEYEMTMKDGISETLQLEVEIKEGLWDSCDPEEIVQSRTGKYMVIHRIIRN